MAGRISESRARGDFVGWAKLPDANASGSVPTIQAARQDSWWARREGAPLPTLRNFTVILRSRALARRLEGSPRALSSAADPSRLAALRRAPQDDGGFFSFINIKFFRFVRDTYPRPQNLAYPDRVLFHEGAAF
jgi:hypothetical protein